MTVFFLSRHFSGHTEKNHEKYQWIQRIYKPSFEWQNSQVRRNSATHCKATVLMKIFRTELKIIFRVVWVPTHWHDCHLEWIRKDCLETTGVKQFFGFARTSKLAHGLCRLHSPTNAHFYFKEHIKIYIEVHINIAFTCFGFRPSSGSLHWTWLKLYLC